MEKKNILSFWRDVEIFTLPDLSDKAKLAGNRLPWEIPSTPEENFSIRHVVYLGKHYKQNVISLIEKLINYTPGEEQQWLEKVNGHTCMAILILNENGQLANENAYLQASYLHGMLCLKENGNLSGINSRLQLVQEKFKERNPYNIEAQELEQLQSPVFTRATLQKEIKTLNDLNIPGMICADEIFVHTYKVSKKSKADTAFLNSFYLDDLNKLIDKTDQWNKGLHQYLRTTSEETKRVNILEDAHAFFDLLHPERLPVGKWPFDPSYGLYTAQAAAIHISLQNLQNDGLTGINGPPGTGKTTLLSDIVANVVTQKAIALLELPDHSLFTKHGVLEKVPRNAYYYYPSETVFSDIGIVVASNNNAAVENISKVLPDRKKIDTSSFPEADYFSAFSQGLIAGEGWGILAAALGNAENKQDFKNNFWYKNEKNNGFGNYLYELYNNEDKEDRTLIFRDKIKETKEKLNGLLKEFSMFQQTAIRFFDAFPQQMEDMATMPVKENQLVATISTVKSSKEQLEAIEANLQQVHKNLEEIMARISFHRSIKPSFFFFHRLFKTRSYKVWNSSYTTLKQKYHDTISEQAAIEQTLNPLLLQIQELITRKNNLETDISGIKSRKKEYQKQKAMLHLLYEIDYSNLPDEQLFQAFEKDKHLFHTSNPWSSKKINLLRTQIFLTSLKLHEYYILSNAKQFRNNISLLMELLDGKVQVDSSLATILWRSFFFCIPVISTSLASVGKLFGTLDKDSVGWLLIDEAGQATPQSAAGIINRCRRSIIIGDPLQIEPVVTIPQKLITMIRQQYNISTEWSPINSSVQSLADRVTLYGTYMETGIENGVWSGFPLRTHRRCNNPMFSIANEIAYSNQMVKAVEDINFICPLGPSSWFDVNGNTIENGQVVIEEIILLQQKIIELGKEYKNIFVISPFKSVANKCFELIHNFNPSAQCGTIHTFQGKESDIVFLILGSDPQRPGSRKWASEKANMLNVALTRAKRRFYVIGNRQLWSSFPFFSVLNKMI